MFRKIKKFTALLLCVILCVGTTAYAAEYTEEIPKDENVNMKIANIDGVKYIYQYCYDENGDSNIYVKNTSNQQTDVVEYNEEAGEVLVNGEIVATIETCKGNVIKEDMNYPMAKAGGYKFVQSKTKKISWKKAVTVAVLAAVISVALGSIGGPAVIAAMGTSALSVIAGASANGIIKYKLYVMKAGKVTNYKYIWSFTPSGGKKYGNYTSYKTV